jgi:hypothetical protein
VCLGGWVGSELNMIGGLLDIKSSVTKCEYTATLVKKLITVWCVVWHSVN